MTEASWIVCEDSEEMLGFLQGKASDRKLRLFACACSRVSWRLLNEPSRKAMEISERYADGLASLDELMAAASHKPHGRRRGAYWNKVRLPPSDQADQAAFATTRELAWDAVWDTVRMSKTLIQDLQCDLIRDVFGNPCRPVPINVVDRWSPDESVARLVQRIYDERAFELMPFLGEALEEIGRADEETLAHCRSNGPHGRGCWVVDDLLGKS